MADGRHSTARPPPPRVLLVESETPARKAITTEVLSGLGLRVAEAASAEAALRAAGANPEPPPAVLVTSTNFLAGRMDGLTLARKARRRWPDLGVIYVTDRPSRLDGHILGARPLPAQAYRSGHAGAGRAWAAGRTATPGGLRRAAATDKKAQSGRPPDAVA